MTEQSPRNIDDWVTLLSSKEMPILRQTARRLEQCYERVDSISGRDIASIVLQDPLMAVRVLAYIQPFTGKHLRSDITTIANAVMMLGIEPFFRKFETPATIEAALKDEPQALLGVLQVIRRVQRASRYAHDWAFERHDLNIEEVTLAALLHDLAEVHYGDTVRDVLHDREIVADEDVREIQLPLQFAEKIDDGGGNHGVQRRGYFVADDE